MYDAKVLRGCSGIALLVLVTALGCSGGGSTPGVLPGVDAASGNDTDAGTTPVPVAVNTDAGASSDSGNASCGCVHGSCGAASESATEAATFCTCEAGFVGALCDTCQPGYTGSACNVCAPGFMARADLAGRCEPDPCADVKCSNHGSCSPEVTPTGIATARCACNPGFQGDTCELCARGYEGADCQTCSSGFSRKDGACVLVACLEVPCGAHGMCADANKDGVGECACATGWTGRACDSCADRYVLENGQCVLDFCRGINCGHGTCEANAAGAMCKCNTGWTGAACDACDTGYTMRPTGANARCVNELPIIDRRLGNVWDAAAPWTISFLKGDLVNVWSNRYGDNGSLMVNGELSAPRKLLIPPAIEFDGVNDALSGAGSFTIKAVESYSVFVVASWNPTKGRQTILDSYTFDAGNATPEAYSLEALTANTVRFRHFDGKSAMADTVTSTQFNANAGPQIIAFERRPFLNGKVLTLSNGKQMATQASVNGPFSSTPVGWVGRCLTEGPGADCYLKGRVSEYIIYNGELTVAERDSIVAYLRVKWSIQ
jgi:Laminin EGF domain